MTTDPIAEMTTLLALLEWYQKSIPVGHSQENYLVQIESTRRLVATRRAELLRNEKRELISQKDKELTSLRKSAGTRTDRLTSIVLGENNMDSLYESTHPSMMSPSLEELHTVQ